MTSQEGGRSTPPLSGVQPHLKIQDTFTSCFVWGEIPEQQFLLGVEYDVLLELQLWDQYKNSIYIGMPVQLNEGSRVVATGTIKEMINPKAREK